MSARRFLIIGLLLVLSLAPAVAGTFFLYIEENFNGSPGFYLSGIRGGIIDAFFESGHIIFDNALDPGGKQLITTGGLGEIFGTALKGGAEYLIAVSVVSTGETLADRSEQITARCGYRLYRVATGELLETGSLEFDNAGREKQLPRDALAFELGRETAASLINAAF